MTLPAPTIPTHLGGKDKFGARVPPGRPYGTRNEANRIVQQVKAMTKLSSIGDRIAAKKKAHDAKAVADLFKVKVKAVNTVIVKGKRKMARGKRYTRSDFKKAIVTLEEGFQIDITTGL